MKITLEDLLKVGKFLDDIKAKVLIILDATRNPNYRNFVESVDILGNGDVLVECSSNIYQETEYCQIFITLEQLNMEDDVLRCSVLERIEKEKQEQIVCKRFKDLKDKLERVRLQDIDDRTEYIRLKKKFEPED